MIFRIFESEHPEQFNVLPRFKEHDRVQRQLRGVCNAWESYLKNYINQTTREFGGTPKLPWEEKERALVSTLVAAIARSYKKAALVAELAVTKRGTKTAAGWCDVWATIPESRVSGHPFSFYLEAKISLKSRPVKNLKTRLSGNYGIAKMFRDHEKNCGKRLAQNSPFIREKGRKHEHYAISLLMLQVKATKHDLPAIREALGSSFSARRTMRLKNKSVKRTMARYPSVALIAIPHDSSRPSMIACLTVLGSTSQLLFNGDSI